MLNWLRPQRAVVSLMSSLGGASSSSIKVSQALQHKSFSKHSKPKGERRKVKVNSDDNPELSDMTAVPSGIDLYSKLISAARISAIAFDLELDPQSVPVIHGFNVFALNVPNGSTTEDIRGAIESVGEPENIYVFSNNSIPSRVSRSIKLSSRTNAVLQFNSEEAFKRCTSDEARLFGVLCKSSGSPHDCERTMFLEPAMYRKSLIITDVGARTSTEDFMEEFRSEINSSGLRVLSMNRACGNATEMVGSDYIVVKFPCFPSAFTALKHLKANTSYNVAFSNLRCRHYENEETGERTLAEIALISPYH